MTTTSSTPDKTALLRPLSLVFFGIVAVLSAVAFINPDAATSNGVELASSSDELWVLVCAALVFLMQAGFLCYEVGLARPANTTSVAIKNLVDWAISTLGFVSVGFGLMFGLSNAGFFGTSFLFLDNIGEAGTSGLLFSASAVESFSVGVTTTSYATKSTTLSGSYPLTAAAPSSGRLAWRSLPKKAPSKMAC